MIRPILIIITTLAVVCNAKAETMVIERIVPPRASLTYSVDGAQVHSVQVPEGRVRVTIEYGGAPIHLRHARRPK